MYIFDGYYIDQHLLRIELYQGKIEFGENSTKFIFHTRNSDSKVREFYDYGFNADLDCELTGVVTLKTTPGSIDYSIAFNKMEGSLEIKAKKGEKCFPELEAKFQIDQRVNLFLNF